MSNRATRRAAIADFRRQAERELETFLVEADTPLDDYLVLRNARLHWYADIPRRKPTCVVCRASFADRVQIGAHLFATAPGSRMVSVSAFCRACFDTLGDDQLSRAAGQVLRRVCPGGRFADEP